MWTVKALYTNGNTESIPTREPDMEVRRILMKDAKANIAVVVALDEKQTMVRRAYLEGVLVLDQFDLQAHMQMKSMDDFARAWAFANYEGELQDFLDKFKGKTKNKWCRALSRFVQKQQESAKAPAWEDIPAEQRYVIANIALTQPYQQPQTA